MRIIRLREHKKTERLSLSKTELLQLVEVKKLLGLRLDARGDGLYDLTPGSIVGNVVCESLTVVVSPKVDVRNLLFLLSYGSGLIDWRPEKVPYESQDDLLRFVVWAFERELRVATLRGLMRAYHEERDALTSLRGRILISKQIATRQGQPLPLECEFENYDEDTTVNRVVKAAAALTSLFPNVGVEVTRNIMFHMRHFADVSMTHYRPYDVPDVAFSHLDRHWEPCFRLGQLLLRHQSLRDRESTHVAMSFTVDMNKVFERFLETLLDEELSGGPFRFDPQGRRRLAADVEMRPDLIVAWKGGDMAVADAKYKARELQDWPFADLYQLLAYCVALGLAKGLLIYASPQALKHHRVYGRLGVQLDVVGVDLTKTPQALLADARVAVRLVAANALERAKEVQAASAGRAS